MLKLETTDISLSMLM